MENKFAIFVIAQDPTCIQTYSEGVRQPLPARAYWDKNPAGIREFQNKLVIVW
jgi:hypothetical protein